VFKGDQKSLQATFNVSHVAGGQNTKRKGLEGNGGYEKIQAIGAHAKQRKREAGRRAQRKTRSITNPTIYFAANLFSGERAKGGGVVIKRGTAHGTRGAGRHEKEKEHERFHARRAR